MLLFFFFLSVASFIAVEVERFADGENNSVTSKRWFYFVCCAVPSLENVGILLVRAILRIDPGLERAVRLI